MRRVAHAVVVLTLLAFAGMLAGCGGSNGPSGPPESVAKRPEKPPPGGDVRYDIIDLGNLTTLPMAVNDAGQVSGGSGKAWVWEAGIMTDLHPAGYDSSAAYQINEAGQIAGRVGPDAVVWERDASSGEWRRTELPTLGGTASDCRGINDAVPGEHAVQVVGRAQDSADAALPAIWEWDADDEAWAVDELGVLAGYTEGLPHDINSSGKIAGITWAGEETRAVMWDAKTGAMQELAGVTSTTSNARVINESDVIVGTGDATPSHAFIWENGAVTDVGVLKNLDQSVAMDINSAGQVVGWSWQQKPTRGPAIKAIYRAFLWEHGELLELNDLIPDRTGWVLRQARGISDNGMIVGNGTLNDELRGFMLVPRG